VSAGANNPALLRAKQHITSFGSAAKPAQTRLSPLSPPPGPTPGTGAAGDDVFLTENDLTKRWTVSNKTLQRWRSTGYGLPYLKLSGKVRYRLQDVIDFERDSARKSTSERLAR